MNRYLKLTSTQVHVLLGALLCLPFGFALASEATHAPLLDLTNSWFGYLAIGLFVIAYLFVILEEVINMRKSKPVIIAAGLIWILVGMAYAQMGDTHTAEAAVRHNLLEYAELMLFLFCAMSFINTMEEREVFGALRHWIVSANFSLRGIFWLTGLLAFILSPVADNLTTALVMAAVAVAVGAGNPAFIAIACINIVVAANAGGAFSPFGDITTLMVWQKGIIDFFEFFVLFIPSVINWLVPAAIMSFAIPSGDKPHPVEEEDTRIKHGGLVVAGLFLGTIVLTVSVHNFLHLPPVLGMMTGFGVLNVFGYYLRRRELKELETTSEFPTETHDDRFKLRDKPFDIFVSIKRVEWDTLMFFYGVILCVGGLGTIGYLGLLSESMYVGLGPTWANILVGVLSAIVDNIPVMFAVLTMQPEMSHGQWLLVTLTAGVGGSLLSIGSAAGVALMGQARGVYTFFGHLKWAWAIALGYAASIAAHLFINASVM